MSLAPTQRTINPPSRPSFCAGRKLGDVEQAWLWTLLHEDPQCPSQLLLDKVAQTHAPLDISVRHLNRLRNRWQRNRPQGRPRHTPCLRPAAASAEVVQMRPRLPSVGVHLCAHWRDHQGAFAPVVAQLTQAIKAHQHAHPGDDVALFHHHDHTLRHRFQALFFAPLFGIEHRTAFDTHAHPLATRLGRSSHSSTLTQCLGQLERVGADAALFPTLVPAQAGQITSSDGHMIASWSRVAMHKGTITMRGRIMAGSPAGIAHHAAGSAVFWASHPPDIPVSRVMVPYCQQVVEATGSTLFVIDRAVNALALAAAFAEQDWGVLCLLDENEPQGLASCEATLEGTLDDGSQVESGAWKAPKDDDDPRHCVIVEPTAGTTLVSWGTPKLKAPWESTAWPRVYRERTERQEHSCKRMSDHGALETHDGRKKIVGPDRHQQRTRECLAASLETAQQRMAKKVDALQAHQAKGEESTSTGHSKRLEQRQQALVRVEQAREEAQNHQAKLVDQANALGPPKERAERDVRTQTIMTCRTVLLENALRAFMAVLLGYLQSQGS